jgi:hypothetical protein
MFTEDKTGRDYSALDRLYSRPLYEGAGARGKILATLKMYLRK